MEQFIYALTDRGYVLSKSEGVDGLLRQETIRHICNFKQSEQKWWGAEACVTISTVKQVQDNFRREGVHNHTLVVGVLEYLAHTQPARLLEVHKWNGGSIPSVLEAIKL